MSNIREQLIHAASGDSIYKTLFEAAADEIGRLQRNSGYYESLVRNSLICDECGGSGFIGSPPDDYFDCPKCKSINNEIRAEAVRGACDYVYSEAIYLDSDVGNLMTEYADKIKRGEL